jgi:hypothetical protein
MVYSPDAPRYGDCRVDMSGAFARAGLRGGVSIITAMHAIQCHALTVRVLRVRRYQMCRHVNL